MAMGSANPMPSQSLTLRQNDSSMEIVNTNQDGFIKSHCALFKMPTSLSFIC